LSWALTDWLLLDIQHFGILEKKRREFNRAPWVSESWSLFFLHLYCFPALSPAIAITSITTTTNVRFSTSWLCSLRQLFSRYIHTAAPRFFNCKNVVVTPVQEFPVQEYYLHVNNVVPCLLLQCMGCEPFSEIGTRALPTSLQTCLAGIPILVSILASLMLGKEYFACNIPSSTLPTKLVLLLACTTSYYLLQHRKEVFKFSPCIYNDLPSQNVSSK
jgi:hypothetical protein